MEIQILNNLIDNIPHCVWWKDENSNLVGCNKNLARFLGYSSPDEIIGKTDFEIWKNIEAEESIKKDREILKTGKSILNYEEKKTKANGEVIWLTKTKIPLRNEDNKIIGTMGWHNDISELRNQSIEIDLKKSELLQYSFELEKSYKELELAKLDLEKFTYAVSHDLQSPIRIINSFSKLLKERLSITNDDKANEFLDFIIDTANRMDSLVKNILLFARSGSSVLSIEHVNINKIVSEKLDDLKQIIVAKSAIIETHIISKEMGCYPDLIGLVFYNLICNGLKFNESKEPRIQVRLKEESNFYIFEVEDNGIGIGNEYKSKVFEPFERLVGKSYEGSGIGLSICQRVVNIHKGEIWIEKSSPEGTIFSFTISKELS